MIIIIPLFLILQLKEIKINNSDSLLIMTEGYKNIFNKHVKQIRMNLLKSDIKY